MGPIALILGGARGVWDDLAAARKATAGRDVILVAVNFAGRTFRDDIDGWATLHPELFSAWRAERAAAGLNTDYRAFGHVRRGAMAEAEVVAMAWSGSSGLYGAQVAVQAMGAAGAILCGVPLEAEAGHYAEGGDWSDPARYRPGWLAAQAAGLPMRSMSGWTRQLLGAPDAAWLDALGVGPEIPRQRKALEATMRVKMLKTRNYTAPDNWRQTTQYLAGQSYTVKREHGEAMVADGDARETRAPARHALDHDGDGRKGGAAAPVQIEAETGDSAAAPDSGAD